MNLRRRSATLAVLTILGIALGASEAAGEEAVVYTVTLDDVIHRITARYMIDALETAKILCRERLNRHRL